MVLNMNHHIEDWISQVCESEKTKDAYQMHVRIFTKFCLKRWDKNFNSIVKDWRKTRRVSLDSREDFLEEWTDIVRSYHTYLQTRKYAPLTIKNLLVTLRSFFRFWDIPINVRLPKRACVIYHNRDLTREDVILILTYATPRDRTIWLVMAESGLRVSTAIGLKYWQIKEDFEKEKVPMRILLPSASLKDHVGDRWTFIGEDGFRHLKNYLQKRLPLKDEDYVFASEKQGKVKGDQFSISSLSVKFSRLVQKLGMCDSRNGYPKAIRQHGLRKYFRNNMRADSAFIQFWMGHSLGVDAHYITRDVERHREEYKRGYYDLRIYDISEPLIRREDVERIVEARVQERIEEQTKKLMEKQKQPLDVDMKELAEWVKEKLASEEPTQGEIQAITKDIEDLHGDFVSFRKELQAAFEEINKLKKDLEKLAAKTS